MLKVSQISSLFVISCQLDSNVSVNFYQVILWIKEQSDTFFPVKVDYSSLPADPQELEDKLRKFKDAARVSRTWQW